jgi:hypothetical protein
MQGYRQYHPNDRKKYEGGEDHTVSRSWSILRRSDAGTEDAEASVLSEASPKASCSFPRSISIACCGNIHVV